MASDADFDAALQAAAKSTGYQLLRVQWNDAQRSKIDGELSCWGPNITDATLVNSTTNRPLLVLRPENMNEKIVTRYSSDDLSVMQRLPDGQLKPTTLRKYLEAFADNRAVIREGGKSLANPNTDKTVSVRYQAVFVPTGTDCHVEHYNYQSEDDNPTNLLLLATSQGTAITRDGTGKVPLYLQSIDPSNTAYDHSMLIESTRFKVGGSQQETAEESAKAVEAGRATTAVIGTRNLGTRLNAFVVIQVPMKQEGCRYRGGYGAPKGAAMCAASACEDEELDGCFYELCSGEGDTMCVKELVRGATPVGKSSAGRVSVGKKVGLSRRIVVKERHESAHMTATVMLFYAVKGGVPSAEDVARAGTELDILYSESVSLADSKMAVETAPVFKGVVDAAIFPV